MNPNLGHPKFVNYEEKIMDSKYQISLLFVTDYEDPISVKYELNESLKLIPILEFKWKLNQLIQEKRLKRVKLIFKKIKRAFRGKKIIKGIKVSFIETDKKGKEQEITMHLDRRRLRKLEYRPFRGKPLHPIILEAKKVRFTSLRNPKFIDDEYCYPQSILTQLNIYPKLKNYYQVKIEFTLSEEITDFLKERQFIMFDIFNKSTNISNSINYHCLVITKNKWNNINIVQATDLHLAQRNDHIYPNIIDLYNSLLKVNPENNNMESMANQIQTELKLSTKKVKKLRSTFPKRLINPNELFRQFIKVMNQKVLQNELDFVIISGDIVDFTISSNISPDTPNNFNYSNSNWKIFKEMLLDINQRKLKGMTKTTELLCPIFVILGNHDFRPWQYDLSWGSLHKKMGLTKEESEIIKTKYSASPIKAITRSDHAIMGYLSEINPSLNFHLRLNKFIFIFLNTGPDSFLKITDFISGKPSVIGISNTQMQYLSNLIKKYENESPEIILSLHGPPINPKDKRSVVTRLKKLFKSTIKTSLDEFKESKFKISLKRESKARIDDKFNLSAGTLASNRENILNFCLNHCILTLSGHTHTFKEFRLEKEIINMNNGEKEESMKVFYDDYSTFYQDADKIYAYGPFVVQTPALGLKAHKGPSFVGSYREIKIRDNKLTSFEVKNVRS